MALFTTSALAYLVPLAGEGWGGGGAALGVYRCVHDHPPCRGVMISISSPLLIGVSAHWLFGSTS